jgi:large subunit ribosomal protein L21
MEYAIIEISGRQFWVEPNKYYTINHVALKVGTKLFLKRVLLVNKEEKSEIGFPYIKTAKIEASILKHFQGQKVLVYKMKPKKKYRKKNGHRQQLSRLFINNIRFED